MPVQSSLAPPAQGGPGLAFIEPFSHSLLRICRSDARFLAAGQLMMRGSTVCCGRGCLMRKGLLDPTLASLAKLSLRPGSPSRYSHHLRLLFQSALAAKGLLHSLNQAGLLEADPKFQGSQGLMILLILRATNSNHPPGLDSRGRPNQRDHADCPAPNFVPWGH